MTVSRYVDDPLYREKVAEKDRADDGLCPDCLQPVAGFCCVPCWDKNRGRVEIVRWNPPADAPAGFFPEDAVPPW